MREHKEGIYLFNSLAYPSFANSFFLHKIQHKQSHFILANNAIVTEHAAVFVSDITEGCNSLITFRLGPLAIEL